MRVIWFTIEMKICFKSNNINRKGTLWNNGKHTELIERSEKKTREDFVPINLTVEICSSKMSIYIFRMRHMNVFVFRKFIYIHQNQKGNESKSPHTHNINKICALFIEHFCLKSYRNKLLRPWINASNLASKMIPPNRNLIPLDRNTSSLCVFVCIPKIHSSARVCHSITITWQTRELFNDT